MTLLYLFHNAKNVLIDLYLHFFLFKNTKDYKKRKKYKTNFTQRYRFSPNTLITTITTGYIIIECLCKICGITHQGSVSLEVVQKISQEFQK